MSSNNDFYISILSVLIIQFGSHCFGDYVATRNLNTFRAIPQVRPPLIHTESFFEPCTIVNNGKGIDLYPGPNSKRNFIFGGPTAPGSVYYEYNVRYNFNASIFGSSGVRINNIGTPITVDSFWYNGKYGSAARASLFPDGIVVIREPVRIGAPNPLFAYFQAVLNLIQKDGSRAIALNGFAVSWLYPPQYVANYLSYRGLYASAINDVPVKYNTATVIVIPFEYSPTISATQFFSFVKLFFGGQSLLQSSSELFKQTEAPLYCVYGPILFKTSI